VFLAKNFIKMLSVGVDLYAIFVKFTTFLQQILTYLFFCYFTLHFIVIVNDAFVNCGSKSDIL